MKASLIDIVDLSEEHLARNNSGSTDYLGLYFDPSTVAFVTVEAGSVWSSPYIANIKRWQDVAGADAQMDPPVDGWETKFDDDLNTADVVNSWGAGKYELRIKDFTGTSDLCVQLELTESDISSSEEILSTTFTSGTNIAGAKYTGSTTNTFSVSNSGAFVGEIIRIRKFNSLVNVLHSYHPDPRSVAQKDWVNIYDDATNIAQTITYPVEDGFYKFLITDDSTHLQSYSGTIIIDNSKINIQGSWSSGFQLLYTTATGVWDSTTGSYSINKIDRYQDSQASDAPREILEDGWELVYDNPTNTADVAVSAITDWGLGDYRVEGLYSSTIRSSRLWVADLSIDNYGSEMFGATAGTNGRAWFDTSAQLIKSETATVDIKKIWKFTGLLRISAQYNVTSLSDGPNQVQAINTDAGDEAVTLPSSPDLGDLFEVWNTGSNGNHVKITTDGSTLYNGLTIGDNKGLKLRYIDGWKYEDVIIDESSGTWASGSYQSTKYSGGRYFVEIYKTDSTSGDKTFTFPVAFSSISSYSGTPDHSALAILWVNGITTSSVNIACNNTGGTVNAKYTLLVEGRWKAGV